MDIFKSARLGDLTALAACIKSGESINSQDAHGLTPLMWAVDMGKGEVVKYLVRAKANLNLQDQYGQTALILAAARNDVASAQILIAAKADLNLKMVTGVTALTVAVENKKNETPAPLKKTGAREDGWRRARLAQDHLGRGFRGGFRRDESLAQFNKIG
jgi:uncharacterized protein